MASNEKIIWDYLKSQGLNDYGIAGLMGNLYAESGMSPKNLQNTFEKSLGFTDDTYTAAVDNGTYANFVRDSAGYGLAQWTYWSRKQNLLNFAKARGVSIGDLNMQLAFLVKELGDYGLLNQLKNAASVLAASNVILLQFEKPADQSASMQSRRAGFGQAYFDKYAASVQSVTSTATAKGDVKSMSNSPLVAYTQLSPNHSGQRKHTIDRISPHCVVGQCTAEALGAWFAKSSTQASSNYGIDRDGRVGLYVEEKNCSWCTSSQANDNRAVTIECASDNKEPYAMNSKVYASIIELCVDICERNGKTKLLWFGDKEKSLLYEPKADEMVLTVHRWFAQKSCPGEWLYSRLGQVAAAVTERLQGEGGKGDEDMLSYEDWKKYMEQYRKELQDNDCGNWSEAARKWAISTGMISGMGNTADGQPNYAWADQLTREQAAALFYRFAQMMGKV